MQCYLILCDLFDLQYEFSFIIWVQEKGAVHLGFSRDLYKVKFELKYLMKSYFMEYYFETTSAGT